MSHKPYIGLVVGLIAGGDGAIRKAVEFAEDDPDGGWKDLQRLLHSVLECYGYARTH